MKDEEETRIDKQIKEAEIKKEEMLRKRRLKRQQMKEEMDHFTDIYWNKKNKENK